METVDFPTNACQPIRPWGAGKHKSGFRGAPQNKNMSAISSSIGMAGDHKWKNARCIAVPVGRFQCRCNSKQDGAASNTTFVSGRMNGLTIAAISNYLKHVVVMSNNSCRKFAASRIGFMNSRMVTHIRRKAKALLSISADGETLQASSISEYGLNAVNHIGANTVATLFPADRVLPEHKNGL